MDRDENHMFPLDMRQILKEQVTDKKVTGKAQGQKETRQLWKAKV
jgi:hypothetical protein